MEQAVQNFINKQEALEGSLQAGLAALNGRVDALEAAAHQLTEYARRLELLESIVQRYGQFEGQAVDTKLLAKPTMFSGKQEDWPDWSFVMNAYCAAVNSMPLLIALPEEFGRNNSSRNVATHMVLKSPLTARQLEV
jgi:hypothetical protein